MADDMFYFVEMVHDESSDIKWDYRFMTRRRESAETICAFLNRHVAILGVAGCDRCDQHQCLFSVIRKRAEIPTYAHTDSYYHEGITNTIGWNPFTFERSIDPNPPIYEFIQEFKQDPMFDPSWLEANNKELIDIKAND